MGGSGNVTVSGKLVAGNGSTITTTALTVSGLDVSGLTLDNVAFTVSGGTITRFDDVTFQNYSATATQLTISHPGAPTPFKFRNARFLVAPTTGRYISATDTSADANVFTIDLIDSDPVDGSSRTTLAGGALVRWSAVVPDADLSVALTAPEEPAEDAPFAYTATVTNNGPAAATAITLTLALPPGVAFTSATPSQGTCAGTGPVTCSLGGLALDGSANVSVVVTPDAPGLVTATATVISGEDDPTPANNTASVSTTVVVGIPGAPAAPSALTTTITPAGRIRLDWTDGSVNESSFQIERRTTGRFVRIATAGRGVTSFEDLTAAPNRTYVYRVRAVNRDGASAFSNDAAVAFVFGKLVVRQRTLAFPVVRVGAKRTLSIEIRNDGAAPLTGRVNGPAAPFSVIAAGGDFTLAPRARKIVTVEFGPSTGETFTGTLRITTNGPLPQSVNVVTRGTAR